MRALAPTCLFLLALPSAAAGAPLTQSPTLNPTVPYRLFSTQNIYTFLLLDTTGGFIVKVQWGTDNAHTFMSPLLATCLGVSANEPNNHVGRYTLEPTQNIWHFLLLDQDTGAVWQVQWSLDGTKDFCDKIPFAMPSHK